MKEKLSRREFLKIGAMSALGLSLEAGGFPAWLFQEQQENKLSRFGSLLVRDSWDNTAFLLLDHDDLPRIELPPNIVEAVWSPDGEQLCVQIKDDERSEGRLDFYDRFGNLNHQGVASEQLFRMDLQCWVPQEQKVLLQGFNQGFYFYNPNQTPQLCSTYRDVCLSPEEEIARPSNAIVSGDPSISPDGQRLVFVFHEWGVNYTFVSLVKNQQLGLFDNNPENVLDEFGRHREYPAIELFSGISNSDMSLPQQWLPDSSGFLYYVKDDPTKSSSINHYDIPTNTNRVIVDVELGVATPMSWDLSSDGTKIALKILTDLEIADVVTGLRTPFPMERLMEQGGIPRENVGVRHEPKWLRNGTLAVNFVSRDEGRVSIITNEQGDLIRKIPMPHAQDSEEYYWSEAS